MAQVGVNLGGWLVLERWITPSLFVDTDARDEFSLASLGKVYQTRISHHYNSFITKKDIAWLHEQNVKQLRVPIGFWLFGDKAPFASGIRYLDRLFDWAEKFDIGIVLSIHAAPGSQNGKMHSGKIGETDWYRHTDELMDFTLRIIKHYQMRKNFIGLGLLNEPDPSRANISHLLRYYQKITKLIKQRRLSVPLYIDGTFRPRLWIIVARVLNTGLDLHLYHGFGHTTDESKTIRRLRLSRFFLAIARHLSPIIVGEWSGVIDQQPDQAATATYIRAQQQAYSPFANFYWTYKTESGGYWSFKYIVTNQK